MLSSTWAVRSTDLRAAISTMSASKRGVRSKKTIIEEEPEIAAPKRKQTKKAQPPPSEVPKQLQPGEKLDRSFYTQDTVTLAKALLGKVLCRSLDTGQVLKGTVVETEAYPGEGDAASHSFKGVPTDASMAMFMDPGTAYVYLTYGMYHCFNISAQDNGGACLLRAADVYEDYEIMHTFRQSKKQREAASAEDKPSSKRLKQHELANGPSKLCMAFDINKATFDKTDMTISDHLWLEESKDTKYSLRQFQVKESRRVGIDRTPPEARYKLYRFYIDENLSVSKAKFKDDKEGASKKSGRSSARSKK